MATAGRKALVRVPGTAVAFSAEATTANAARTEYQVTNTARRVWSRSGTVFVELDTGGGYNPVAASLFTVDRLSGKIIFFVAQPVGAAVRVQMDAPNGYLPMSTAAEAKEYTYTLAGKNATNGKFGDTYTRRQQVQKDVSGSLTSWRTVDTFFDLALTAGTPVVLEFFSDAAAAVDARVWALLNSEEIRGAVDGLQEQVVSFEGAADDFGRSVSFG